MMIRTRQGFLVPQRRHCPRIYYLVAIVTTPTAGAFLSWCPGGGQARAKESELNAVPPHCDSAMHGIKISLVSFRDQRINDRHTESGPPGFEPAREEKELR
jgi:hypothetical protein